MENDQKWPTRALWPSFKEFDLIFAIRENLRIFPNYPFTRGVAAESVLALSVFAAQIHLSQRERPWQKDEVCGDCQGLSLWESWQSREALTERASTLKIKSICNKIRGVSESQERMLQMLFVMHTKNVPTPKTCKGRKTALYLTVL